MNSYKGSSIGWYSYNLPSVLNGAGQSSQFWYGPNRNRWKQVASYSGGSETTIYVAGILEKVTTAGGTVYRHYVGAGSAQVVYSRSTTGAEATKYITADHLNSSTVVMDSAGAALVNLSFASFGARRGSAWSGSPSAGDWTQIANATRHGYTGHEQLDNIKLIHMNGRVFDPALGRFLSADPFMPGSLGSQAPNRYAYVGNRPLSLIDPSGYFPRGGNAMKQWIDKNGLLDFQEIAIYRGWASWGGVRNVSDGMEGTHVGLFEHSMQNFIDNQAAGQQSTHATLWAIAASGYRTPQQSMGSFANANRVNGAGATRTAGTSDANCEGCMSTVTVTASRIGGQERISWSPGRVGSNGPGLGGTGSFASGSYGASGNRNTESAIPADTHQVQNSTYWQRYAEHIDNYLVEIPPEALVVIGIQFYPKSLPSPTDPRGRGQVLGSRYPFTNVPRAFGLPYGTAVGRSVPFNAFALAIFGFGIYNSTVLVSGLVYAYE